MGLYIAAEPIVTETTVEEQSRALTTDHVLVSVHLLDFSLQTKVHAISVPRSHHHLAFYNLEDQSCRSNESLSLQPGTVEVGSGTQVLMCGPSSLWLWPVCTAIVSLRHLSFDLKRNYKSSLDQL